MLKKDEEKNEEKDEDDCCNSYNLEYQLYSCNCVAAQILNFECFDATCREKFCSIQLAVGETQVDMTNEEACDFFTHFSTTVAHCTDTGDCYTISFDMGTGKVKYTKKLMR
jgi:hypothetical protein